MEWKPLQVGPWVACLSCNAPVPVLSHHFAAHFEGRKVQCSDCSNLLDWWRTVVRAVREDKFGWAFAAVGAQSTVFQIVLPATPKVVEVEFSQHGVPTDAKLLHVQYTPQSGTLFPIEVHGNDPERILRPKVLLYPRPFRDGDAQEDTEVAVWITWIRHGPDDMAWEHLITAIRSYRADTLAEAVMPANIASEMTLTRLLKDFLAKHQIGGQDRIKRFLTDAATYAHQLNVVLPMVTRLTGSPELPSEIHSLLNYLRDLRNQIGHSGRFDSLVTRLEIADCLTASIFAVHYCDFMRAKLDLP